jgi:hypothetical protein
LQLGHGEVGESRHLDAIAAGGQDAVIGRMRIRRDAGINYQRGCVQHDLVGGEILLISAPQRYQFWIADD